jgi:hypothetical protein
VSIPNPHIRFSYEGYRSLVATSDKRYELFDGDIPVANRFSGG